MLRRTRSARCEESRRGSLLRTADSNDQCQFPERNSNRWFFETSAPTYRFPLRCCILNWTVLLKHAKFVHFFKLTRISESQHDLREVEEVVVHMKVAQEIGSEQYSRQR